MPELLDTREVQITRHHKTPLRFNVGDTAHFVTHYSPELLARLIEEVQNRNLDILGRLQLLHEQTLLARGGMISTAELLPLLPAYKDETTEAVWDIISLAIGELKKFVEDDKQAEQALRRLSAELARSEYTRLGWTQRENENEQDTKLRATIIAMMLYGEDSDAIATAKNLYENTAIEALNPELRSLIIGAVVRHHESPELISNLLDTYRQTSSAELQQDIASGLTSTRRTETISALLARITDTSFIRTQDTARWVIWLLRNRDGRTLTWNWLRENWDWIEKTFAGDKSYDDYPRYSAGVLTKRSQLDEYREFFMPLKDVPALSRVIAMGIVEIEGRVELLERDGEAVRKALLEL
jgi:aminopeptidase N